MSAHSEAAVLELGYAKSKDAHCLSCGFQMAGGRYVGLCPKCGSDRWYRTRLTEMSARCEARERRGSDVT